MNDMYQVKEGQLFVFLKKEKYGHNNIFPEISHFSYVTVISFADCHKPCILQYAIAYNVPGFEVFIQVVPW